MRIVIKYILTLNGNLLCDGLTFTKFNTVVTKHCTLRDISVYGKVNCVIV